MTLSEFIRNRRTFAIISHPDAGKTTLTEKLLLFGGAIQMAGMVKARGDARRDVDPLQLEGRSPRPKLCRGVQCACVATARA